MNSTSRGPARTARPGTTLLEVLVACGILVVGLASVAAILPAAGTLLAEASAIDRSSALLANAVPDLQARGALSTSLFNGPPIPKVVLIGGMFPALQGSFTTIPDENLAIRGPVDEAAYGGSSYGVMVEPLDSQGRQPQAGTLARVTIAVFRKSAGESKLFQLANTIPGNNGPLPLPPGVFRLTAGGAEDRDADRKGFLAPCSWVLVTTGDRARWLQVGSSWSTRTPAGAPGEAFVSFTNSDEAMAGSTGQTLAVYGFPGIMRVEDRIVPLN